MRTKEKRRGISLLTLVITIMVIAILSTVVILILVNNNPIENAKQSVFKNDIIAMQEELNTYITNKRVLTSGTYDETSLYANKESLQEEGSKVDGKTIKDVIKTMEKKYLDKIEVIAGKLEYTNLKNIKELEWADEILGNNSNLNYAANKTENENNIKLNSVKSIRAMKIYGNTLQEIQPTPNDPVEVQGVGNKVKIPIVTDNESFDNLINTQNWVSGTNNAGFNENTNINYITSYGENYVEATLPAWSGIASDFVNVSDALKFGFKLNKDVAVDDYESYVVILQLYDKDKNKLRSFSATKIDLKANTEATVINDGKYYRSDFGQTITVPSEAIYARLAVVSRAQKVEGLRIYDFYATKGNDTNDESYDEKYIIPITIRSENLINPDNYGYILKDGGTTKSITFVRNPDGSLTINGTASGDLTLNVSTDNGFIDGDNSGTYTLCGCYGGSDSTYYLQSQNGYRDVGNGVKVTSTIDKNTIRFFVKSGAVFDNVTIYPMLIKGDYVGKTVEFKPYIEPITTDIYLDEPLRKIGEYVDYIDISNKRVVRYISKLNLTSSTKFTVSANTTDSKFITYFYISDSNGITKESTDILSNYFPTVESYQYGYYGTFRAGNITKNQAHFVYANNEYLGIDENDTTNELKLEKFKKWLDEKNLKEPVLIYYHLEQPRYEQIDIPSLGLNKGATIVDIGTSVAPSKVDIIYDQE